MKSPLRQGSVLLKFWWRSNSWGTQHVQQWYFGTLISLNDWQWGERSLGQVPLEWSSVLPKNQQRLHLSRIPMVAWIVMSKALMSALSQAAMACITATWLFLQTTRFADISIAVVGPAIGDDEHFHLRVPGATWAFNYISVRAIWISLSLRVDFATIAWQETKLIVTIKCSEGLTCLGRAASHQSHSCTVPSWKQVSPWPSMKAPGIIRRHWSIHAHCFCSSTPRSLWPSVDVHPWLLESQNTTECAFSPSRPALPDSCSFSNRLWGDFQCTTICTAG